MLFASQQNSLWSTPIHKSARPDTALCPRRFLRELNSSIVTPPASQTAADSMPTKHRSLFHHGSSRHLRNSAYLPFTSIQHRRTVSSCGSALAFTRDSENLGIVTSFVFNKFVEHESAAILALL